MQWKLKPNLKSWHKTKEPACIDPSDSLESYLGCMTERARPWAKQTAAACPSTGSDLKSSGWKAD